MQTSYEAIYLSPHLDDVALSCGAQVFQRTRAGQRILIVTVMAGSPPPAARSSYIDNLHTRWQLAGDAAAQRRAEDIDACAILGAGYLHLDVPDCIYRYDPHSGAPLYTSDDDIFGDVHAAEEGLPRQIAASFAQLPPAAQVVSPLAVGHHVDHLLVRAAAEQVWSNDLWYYEDYPYVEKRGNLLRVLGDDLRAWRPNVYEIGPADLQARCDAIWAFRSQLSTFFGSREDMEARLAAEIERVGGERLWHKL